MSELYEVTDADKGRALSLFIAIRRYLPQDPERLEWIMATMQRAFARARTADAARSPYSSPTIPPEARSSVDAGCAAAEQEAREGPYCTVCHAAEWMHNPNALARFRKDTRGHLPPPVCDSFTPPAKGNWSDTACAYCGLAEPVHPVRSPSGECLHYHPRAAHGAIPGPSGNNQHVTPTDPEVK